MAVEQITGLKERVLAEYPDYSKKVIGKMLIAFDHSRLQIVGGNHDGDTLKARHFMDTGLPPQPPLIESADRLEVLTRQSVFNNILPKAVEAMLLVDTQHNHPPDAYLKGVGGIDLENLLPIATSITEGQTSETVLRLVYGPTTAMPFRGLSYIVPPLLFLQNLHDQKLQPPQLQVIFTNHLGTNIGGEIDLTQAQEQTRALGSAARRYTQEFFPQVANQVVFAEDTSAINDKPIQDELSEIAEAIHTRVSPETHQALDSKGRNGTERRYAAAHLLVHDTPFSDYLTSLFPGQTDLVVPHTIISIGGIQERLFYQTRQEVRPHLPGYAEMVTLQYFTRHAVPPYYQARGGDRLLAQVAAEGKLGDVEDPTIDPAARYDLAYIKKISEARGDFEKFIDTMSSH